MNIKIFSHVINEQTNRYIWAVCTPERKTAVQLWLEVENDIAKYGVIEIHCSVPPEYDTTAEPHTKCCFLLLGPCWTNGSSLAAEPFVEIFNGGGLSEFPEDYAFATCEKWLNARK